MITIINYGAGNLHSVAAIFKRIGQEFVISSHPDDIKRATRLVLPGVGAIGPAMKKLADLGIVPLLKQRALEEKVPFLGICLGFQMLSQWSEEGDAEGLGWIDAVTRKFRFEEENPPPVPHLGWNEVDFARPSPLLAGLTSGSCFYFAHSFHVVCESVADVLTTTHYGQDFVSAVQAENIVGVQFHPEKSLVTGQQLVRNFLGGGGDAQG